MGGVCRDGREGRQKRGRFIARGRMGIGVRLSKTWTRRVVTIAILLFATGATVRAGALDAAAIQRVARSLVKVTADSCPGPPRAGAGFVWKDQNTAVTALHV